MWNTAKNRLMVAIMFVASGCGSKTTDVDILTVAYSFGRTYTGQTSNQLTITADEGAEDEFTFSLSSDGAEFSVSQNTLHPVKNQTIDVTYTTEGVHTADFKIFQKNGEPYLYELLNWEYSTEVPDAPVISFADTATNKRSNILFISDSRQENVTSIWLQGDLDTSGKILEDEGFWLDINSEQISTPVTLTSGDGLKTINAKFRNIYGNESDVAVPATITLKEQAPTDCDATALSTTISNNKLSVRLNGTDTGLLYYSVTGDLKLPVVNTPFTDGETVFIYTSASEGTKSLTIYIEDEAGNFCLEEPMTIVLDPDYESEGIFVDNATYWTTTENISVDIFFNHFPDQEPLQLKISGDVAGDNTNAWIPYATDIDISLNPTTTGSRRILAQYKDVDGTESYLISKRIFLKPTVTLPDAGAPFVNVVASDIQDAESLTITGCKETYNEVDWQAAFVCEPDAAQITVTWQFPEGDPLVISETP